MKVTLLQISPRPRESAGFYQRRAKPIECNDLSNACLNRRGGNNAIVTLDGLPLASEYTLLIDTSVGDNAKLDLSKLEDVRIRINSGYQDLFAEGQCIE